MKILFICTGNICRSPTAHGVLEDLAKKEGLPLEVDSAGTIDHHEGEGADPRTVSAAQARGFDLTHIRSRPIEPEDFLKFDYIFAMDSGHLRALQEQCPPDLLNKKQIMLYMEFSEKFKSQSVPDPYFGGEDGFGLVLDMIEDASRRFIEHLKSTNS